MIRGSPLFLHKQIFRESIVIQRKWKSMVAEATN